ncbi:hypothetical protein OAX78_04595 [Planctomycetota bacterium]|nr:hypothetical protein [Planctomycetota bacterium]
MLLVDVFADLGVVGGPYTGPLFVILTFGLSAVGSLPVFLLAWRELARQRELPTTERGLGACDAVLAGIDGVVVGGVGLFLAHGLLDLTPILRLVPLPKVLATLWLGAFVALLAIRSFTPSSSRRTLTALLRVSLVTLAFSTASGALVVSLSGGPALGGAIWGGFVGTLSFGLGSSLARVGRGCLFQSWPTDRIEFTLPTRS